MSHTTVFTPEETSLLLEAARAALCDADIFDMIAVDTDTADNVLAALREKLHFALNDSTAAEIQLDTRESGEMLELDGESCNDYRFSDKSKNVWVRVDGLVVNIARREYDGSNILIAEIFEHGTDSDTPLAECCASL